MAEPGTKYSESINLLSSTKPSPLKRASSLEKLGNLKETKLVRCNTLPEFEDISKKFESHSPSHFGWFNRDQSFEEYRQVLLQLAKDKQMEIQLEQMTLLDELEKEREHMDKEEPLTGIKAFQKAARKVLNMKSFLTQIEQSIQARNLTPKYPKRSSFNGVSRDRKCPQIPKMAEIVECTKRKTWRQTVWNKIKVMRRLISTPILKVESLVESRFGSSAVSYFALLQRLIALNFFIAFLSVFIWLPAILPCPTALVNSSNGSNATYVSACIKPIYIPSTDPTTFLTGRGLENTSLFLGFYRFNNIPGWDYKSAFFYTFFLSTFTILVYISYFLGQAYIDTFSILNSTRHVSSYMANIVFGGWTYTLTNSFSVKSEHNRLMIVLREIVWECSPRYQSQRRLLFGLVDRITPGLSHRLKRILYVFLLWVWRGAIWLVALGLLAMGAALIVVTALQRVCPHTLLFYGFIPSLWHSFLELVFSGLTALEFYDMQRKAMISLLIKHLLMRLISLCSIYTVVVVVYILSRCKGLSTIPFVCFSSGFTREPVDCLASGCWETEVAKIFHEYLIAQFISSIVIRSLIITLQNFIRIGVFQFIKRCSYCSLVPGNVIGWIKSFFNTPFHLPKHVIKVIYIQSLIWSGMLFCPYQHIIGFIGFVLLYVSMFVFTMWNCRISPKQPRTARSNLIYYIVIFSTFFFIMIALHFPLFQFIPSDNCGPYSGTRYYYEFYKDIHLKWVSETFSIIVGGSNCTDPASPDCFDRLTLVSVNFWDSPATGPLTVLACGILLLYFATLKKKNYEIVQLRKQVLLLAVDRSFYIQGNAHFLYALSQKYLKDKRAQAAYTAVGGKKMLLNNQ